MNRPQRGPLPSLSEFTAMSSARAAAPVVQSSRDDIGLPVTFTDGQFKGRTLRAELVELQKADLGRKYARKDRRPLDPPPVVQLKLYDILRYGTQYEEHKEFESYDDMGGFGILCHIDLFSVHAQDEPVDPTTEGPNKRPRRSPSHTRPASSSTPSISTPTSASSTPTPSVASPSFSYAGQPAGSPSYPSAAPPHAGSGYGHYPAQPGAGGPYTLPPPAPPNSNSVTLPPISTLNPPGSSFPPGFQLPPMHGGPFARSGLTLPPLPTDRQPASASYTYPPPQPPQPRLPPPHELAGSPPPASAIAESTEGKPVRAGPEAPEGVLAYLNGREIREEDKCTEALSGATIAQSQSLEYLGRKVLMFVFSDIAVRNEGTFILRYRVFNIFGKVAGRMTEIPVLAECYGGPFRIYSTKEFPGLRPSTELTKHLSMFGVRLNLRETERKRRRGAPSGEGSPGPSDSARGRRRRRRRRGDDDSDDPSSAEDDD